MSSIISKNPLKIKTSNYESTEITIDLEKIYTKLYGSNKSKSQFFDQVFAIKISDTQNSLQNCFAGGFFEPLFLREHRFLGVIPQVIPLPPYGNIAKWYQGYHLSEAKCVMPLNYHFTDCESWRAPKPFPRSGDVVWGIDTEYQDVGGSNEIISTQIWLYELDCGFIFFHKAGERTEISTLTSLILAFLGVHLGEKKATKYKFWFIGHYNIAEYASLSIAGRNELLQWDNELKQYTKRGIGQIIRKSVATLRPRTLKLRTAHTAYSRQSVGVSFEFRDTFLINPVSLKKIGESIGLPKLDIGDDIAMMSELRKNDLARFIDYAIRDAHISAKYFVNYIDICHDFGIEKIPITSSGLGVAYLRTKFDTEEFKKVTLGEETKIYSKNGYLRPIIRYSSYLEMWKKIYHGGRNECFVRDFNRDEITYDYDLVNAYLTSMLSLGLYDVSEPAKYYDDDNWLNEIKPSDLGICKIEFVCHDWVKYPPFAYEDPSGRGLIHFKRGVILTSSIELWTAIKNGLLKHVRLIWGAYYPSLGENPIQNTIEELIRLREAEKAINPLKAGLYKLIGNSIYGKFAQGLKRINMPESALTCPAIAAQITGSIRAVIAEQMNYLAQQDHELISVTTDGYFSKSEITPSQMQEIDKLPLSSIMADGRERHGLGRKILELKHKGKGWACLRTRAYGMFEKVDDNELLFAKGGIKIDTDQTNFEKYQYMVQVALNGGYDEVSMTPKNEIFQNRKDLVNITKENKKVLLDLDFKRFHYEVQDLITGEVRIETRPYESLEEYEKFKDIYEKIYDRSDEMFKHRNMHFTPERFLEFYLAKAIYPELPKGVKLDSVMSFCVEVEISKPENSREFKSDRVLARELGVSSKTINKWRNNGRVFWNSLSDSLKELVSLYVEMYIKQPTEQVEAWKRRLKISKI
jgi:DNA-directed DNA polymerase